MSRKTRAKIAIIFGVVLLVIVAFMTFNRVRANNAGDGIDYDCSDFAYQEDAQQYFTSHGGGTTKGVDNLDGDHNGIACESLKKAPTFNYLEGIDPSTIPVKANEPTWEDFQNGNVDSSCLNTDSDPTRFDLDWYIKAIESGRSCRFTQD